MSLQTKPLVGKEISSLNLGYASATPRLLEEIPLPTSGLVCKDTKLTTKLMNKPMSNQLPTREDKQTKSWSKTRKRLFDSVI